MNRTTVLLVLLLAGCGLSLDLDPGVDGGALRDGSARTDGRVVRCRVDDGCDDGDPCTADTCDSSSRECHHSILAGAACDDGDPCTEGDACRDDGSCGGEELCPDDGNPCTAIECDGTGGCSVTPLDGTSCDDGIACTGDGVCRLDTCQIGPDSCPPPPSDPCITANLCDLGTGLCAWRVAFDAACDDGDPCTAGDSCAADGSCVGGSACAEISDECAISVCTVDPSMLLGYHCSRETLTDTPCGPGGADTCIAGRCGCALGMSDCDGVPGCECLGVCGGASGGGTCMAWWNCGTIDCPMGLFCCVPLDRCITSEQLALCPMIS